MVNRIPALLLLALISLCCYSCMQKNEDKAGAPTSEANPLLQKWEGPTIACSPFDKVQVSLFQPAFEAAMTEARNEINGIASNTDAPTLPTPLRRWKKVA